LCYTLPVIKFIGIIMKKIIFTAVIGSLLATAQAAAPSSFSAGLGVSTLGIGANVGYKINNSFKVRGVTNYFKFNKSVKDGDITLKGKLRLFTIGLLGDWHFLQNGLRLTGGLVYNGNQLNITATPSNSHSYNGVTYTPQQIGTVKGNIKFRPIAPYLGLGFDSGHESASGFSFNADAGVLFQGNARGKIKSISGTLANNATAIENVKNDAVKAINKKSLIKYYPVISLGVSYKF